MRAEIPSHTVVINNLTMGGYDEKMPVAMAKYGVGNQSGDYAGVAQALGASPSTSRRSPASDPRSKTPNAPTPRDRSR